MKSFSTVAVLITALAVPVVRGQQAKSSDAPSPAPSAAAVAAVANEALGPQYGPERALKVQVLITEENGSQKLNSLPYTLNVVQNAQRSSVGTGSVRMDTQVPVTTESVDRAGGPPAKQFTYMGVGTDIDCRLVPFTGVDGRFHLSFNIHRSSLLSSTGSDLKQGETIPTGQPLTRSFQDSFDVIIRDGQTVEGSTSVDPSTGNVMKVDVTLNVEK